MSLGGDGLGCQEPVGKEEYMPIVGMLRELYALSMCTRSLLCRQFQLCNIELEQYMQNEYVMMEYLVSLFRLVHFITRQGFYDHLA